MNKAASPVVIGLFFAIVGLTLVITYWSAKRSRTAGQMYAAGGRITALQNGLAIVGDLMSAAAVLGGLAMFYDSGYDTIIYFASTMTAFTIMLAIIAGPLRRLGRYTFADVLAARLSPVPVRILAAVSTLAITLGYLVPQMIGAGGLIEILFGIPYAGAIAIIGALMITYVAFGGMLATTWVQITKAVLMISGLTVMAGMVMARAGFRLGDLYRHAAAVHPLGENLFQPGGMHMSPLNTVSLAIGTCFGIAGLPHILMRFFTVRSPQVARRSVVIALAGMFYVHGLIFLVLGAAGVLYVTGNPAFIDVGGAPRGGSNMVTLHLASYLGGNVLFGFMAAVVLCTILAVVAGLTVAASAAISHDLYAGVLARGRATDRRERIVFRAACLVIGSLGVLLAIAFRGQNIIYLTGMVFSISASACFPVLILSIYWSRLTTAGAVAGGAVGLALSVGTLILGPSIWVHVLGHASPIFPTDQPAIFSMPAAFAVMIVVSLLTKRAPASARAQTAVA